MDRATAVRIWREVSGGVDDIVTGRTLEAFASRVEVAEREACAACVPTTWLDPMLTGPEKVLTGRSTADIQMVLESVKARIMARSNVK